MKGQVVKDAFELLKKRSGQNAPGWHMLECSFHPFSKELKRTHSFSA